LNDVTMQPCGLTPVKTRRIVPSLPGVEPLEDQQDASPSFGVEPLLQRRKLLEQRSQLSLGVLLRREAERVARVAPLELCGRPGRDDERIQHRRSLRRLQSHQLSII